ncbi:MAG TPA: UDP-glucose 4-epimerase GalE [Galbitalea sp.]|jgi:UDP-glucose 4-epimerase|nr:UDP-glucose 4-epimerase GalE [Galbitalea sp.]
MRVLVTGGAGYIGAHTVLALSGRGHSVVVVDDLVTGRPERIAGIPLKRLDLASDTAPSVLEDIMRAQRIDAVIHFAARKQVGESAERPAWYYRENLGGLANLLIAMERAQVRQLVFSSSAAVYGGSSGAVSESEPTAAISPYGETKLAGEWLVTAACRAWGLGAASLRYFNVAGAGRPELGDTAILNLVPIVLERLDAGEAPIIFGSDYETPDGTCIRDYVHVVDVAEAHLAALETIESAGPINRVFNVGRGEGTSVLEMIAAIGRVSGNSLAPTIADRRPGDPAFVVARVEAIRAATGWRARLGLDEIVRSAWESHLYFAGRPMT